MRQYKFLLLVAVTAWCFGSWYTASATQINTGGESGAYFGRFCPELRSALRKSEFDYECVTSTGSRENIQRVMGDASQLAYSQFDAYALERKLLGGERLFTTLRTDLGRECLFMVTRNRELSNFGEVAALAAQLSVVLPPKTSGSAATFEFLQQIDPDGLGKARDIMFVSDADRALEQALAADDIVALFVQFPDAENARFKMINEAEGVFIPVIDRNILRQRIGGEKVYYAQETEISNPKWHKRGNQVITSCTPIVIFTGRTKRIDDETARKDHEDLIKTVQDIKVDDLQPKTSFFERMWRKTKELSGTGIEKMLEISEKAREAAGPMVEQAREKSKELMDQAGELADDAKEKGKQLMDKATETTQ